MTSWAERFNSEFFLITFFRYLRPFEAENCLLWFQFCSSLSWSCSCSCGSSVYRTEIFNNLTKWITIGNLQQSHGDEKCALQTLKVGNTMWRCTVKISLFIHDFSLHCLPELCLAILNNKSEKSTEKCENLFFPEKKSPPLRYWQDGEEESFKWDGQWRFFGILLH